jgi:hypothetical protein
MKYLILLLSIKIICSGCSSKYMINRNYSTYKELNNELEGEEVTIELLNGDEITAENVKISYDSSSWAELKLSYGFWIPNDSCRTPTSNIKMISFKNNSKGAWEWMGWGALIGLPTGALIGWNVTSGDRFFSRDGSGESLEGIGIAIGGLVGLGSGLIIGPAFGAIVGHKETYILNDPVELDLGLSEAYFTVEIKSILEETKQSIFFEWENKIIHMPKSEIKERIDIDNNIYFRVDELTYITYFK